MKKIIALILAVLFVCGALVACGGDTKEDTSKAGNTDATKDEATTAPATTEFKAGFIMLHDENSTYDKNFIDAAKKACENLGVECIIKTGVDESDACYKAAVDMVDEGCGFVFADSFGHENFMIQAAQEYPDVQFAHATGTQAHTVGLDNFHNAFASIYEGRYLAGVAAGMKLNEMIESGKITAEQAKIGYVGAFTYAEVISGYTSFFLGARSICPSATMEVTFTGSWYDQDAEKEAATSLIQKGCVLISQHADSMGAPTACEDAGVPNISYNGSTIEAGPNTFIVSSKIDWTPYFEYAIKATMEGKNFDTDWTGTLATGSVVLSEINENAAAAGTAEKIAEVKAALEAGTLHVYDTATFTKDGETLTTYMADVDTDAAYTPDTEVISDGYFHESEFRSAPYFDIQIDGITLLNTNFG